MQQAIPTRERRAIAISINNCEFLKVSCKPSDSFFAPVMIQSPAVQFGQRHERNKQPLARQIGAIERRPGVALELKRHDIRIHDDIGHF